MKRVVGFIVPTVVCLWFGLVVAVRAEDKKVDPTGAWTWSIAGRDGTAREVTGKLKLEDGKLTGTVTSRQGAVAIEDAKFAGEDISFKVTREFNGTEFVQRFTGKVSADTIKGKIEFDRNGEPQSLDWNAKRSEVKPSEPVVKPAEPAPKPAQP